MPASKKTEQSGFIREMHVIYKRKRTKNPAGNATITGPEKVVELFRDLQDETKEKLIIVNLDGASKILAFEVVAIGSTNSCYARPIEIFTSSFLTRATGGIVIHNHPSGQVEPSKSDIEFTKKLLDTADTIGLKLVDHIIIGYEGYYSFASESKLASRFGWY
jgi:DNA repair protein RadC